MGETEFQNLIQKAKTFAKKKEFYKFARNITLAENLAKTDKEKQELYLAEISGLMKNNSYKDALEAVRKTDNMFDDPIFKMNVLMKKGVIFGHLEKFDRALETLNYIAKSDFPEKKARAHINIIWIYELLYLDDSKEEYLDKAEESCNKVLELLETCELSDRNYNIFLTNLGCLYYRQEKYEKSLEVFMELKDKLVDEGNYAITHNNIASVLVEENRIKEAKEYLHKALLKAEQLKDYNEIAENYMVEAEIAMIDEDYNRVRDNYVVAYDYFVKAKNLQKACMVLKDIQSVDFRVNNESLDKLSRQLKNA